VKIKTLLQLVEFYFAKRTC